MLGILTQRQHRLIAQRLQQPQLFAAEVQSRRRIAVGVNQADRALAIDDRQQHHAPRADAGPIPGGNVRADLVRLDILDAQVGAHHRRRVKQVPRTVERNRHALMGDRLGIGAKAETATQCLLARVQRKQQHALEADRTVHGLQNDPEYVVQRVLEGLLVVGALAACS